MARKGFRDIWCRSYSKCEGPQNMNPTHIVDIVHSEHVGVDVINVQLSRHTAHLALLVSTLLSLTFLIHQVLGEHF